MKNMSTPIFIAAAVLGISLAHPMSVRADAPQHHDQVPGFHRLAVGDLEVTSLYDGGGQFEPRWLNGQKKVMTAVASTVQKEPHFLDGAESGFLVNTGKQVILVDAGAGQWWGGGALGRLETSLRSAGYPAGSGRMLVAPGGGGPSLPKSAVDSPTSGAKAATNTSAATLSSPPTSVITVPPHE